MRTPSEASLARHLRKLGLRFQQNVQVLGFEVDFYFETGLVVEVDGYVHVLPEVAEKDRRKEALLMTHGYSVLRFTNLEILMELRTCCRIIRDALDARSFTSSSAPLPPWKLRLCEIGRRMNLAPSSNQ